MKKVQNSCWYLLVAVGIKETCICILVINTEMATKGASIKYCHNFFFLFYLTWTGYLQILLCVLSCLALTISQRICQKLTVWGFEILTGNQKSTYGLTQLRKCQRNVCTKRLP